MGKKRKRSKSRHKTARTHRHKRFRRDSLSSTNGYYPDSIMRQNPPEVIGCNDIQIKDDPEDTCEVNGFSREEDSISTKNSVGEGSKYKPESAILDDCHELSHTASNRKLKRLREDGFNNHLDGRMKFPLGPTSCILYKADADPRIVYFRKHKEKIAKRNTALKNIHRMKISYIPLFRMKKDRLAGDSEFIDGGENPSEGECPNDTGDPIQNKICDSRRNNIVNISRDIIDRHNRDERRNNASDICKNNIGNSDRSVIFNSSEVKRQNGGVTIANDTGDYIGNTHRNNAGDGRYRNNRDKRRGNTGNTRQNYDGDWSRNNIGHTRRMNTDDTGRIMTSHADSPEKPISLQDFLRSSMADNLPSARLKMKKTLEDCLKKLGDRSKAATVHDMKCKKYRQFFAAQSAGSAPEPVEPSSNIHKLAATMTSVFRNLTYEEQLGTLIDMSRRRSEKAIGIDDTEDDVPSGPFWDYDNSASSVNPSQYPSMGSSQRSSSKRRRTSYSPHSSRSVSRHRSPSLLQSPSPKSFRSGLYRYYDDSRDISSSQNQRWSSSQHPSNSSRHQSRSSSRPPSWNAWRYSRDRSSQFSNTGSSQQLSSSSSKRRRKSTSKHAERLVFRHRSPSSSRSSERYL